MNTRTSLMILCLSLFFSAIHAQMAEDFTVTDTDGQVHRLYADHLNQGQTVVIKLFFVGCPPCNNIAPQVQSLYETWGSGQYDVEFIEMTTISGDSNADVIGFKTQHGLTFPAISSDGGAPAAVLPFKSGTYGTYWGTPSFAVIAPDGTVNYPLSFGSVHDAIVATGATGSGSEPVRTTYQLRYEHPNNNNIKTEYLTATLHPAGSNSPAYNITQMTNGSLAFEYPSANIPQMDNPVITITSNAPGNIGGISAFDIVKIRKHILNFEPFENAWQISAADVTGEGSVSAFDVVQLQKVILGFESHFPNGAAGQKILNNDIPLPAQQPGNTIEVKFQVVRKGDVN